jgi:hypothetical protein
MIRTNKKKCNAISGFPVLIHEYRIDTISTKDAYIKLLVHRKIYGHMQIRKHSTL